MQTTGWHCQHLAAGWAGALQMEKLKPLQRHREPATEGRGIGGAAMGGGGRGDRELSFMEDRWLCGPRILIVSLCHYPITDSHCGEISFSKTGRVLYSPTWPLQAPV